MSAPQGVTPACRCGCHRYGTTTACADCPDRHTPALDLAERLEALHPSLGWIGNAAAKALRDQSATIEALRGALRDGMALVEQASGVLEDHADRGVHEVSERWDDWHDAARAALAQPEETT